MVGKKILLQRKIEGWEILMDIYMKTQRTIIIIIITCLFLNCQKKAEENQITDSQRFAIEYPLLPPDNIFVYRNANETADILEKGRGVVFMGFKECPWCQYYAALLHETALEMEIEKIFYLDIKQDRENNTEDYQNILGIINRRLQYDDEGKPRIFVPDLSIVSRGRMITRDYETSKDTHGHDNPEDYWTEERITALKEKLKTGMDILNQISRRPCTPC